MQARSIQFGALYSVYGKAREASDAAILLSDQLGQIKQAQLAEWIQRMAQYRREHPKYDALLTLLAQRTPDSAPIPADISAALDEETRQEQAALPAPFRFTLIGQWDVQKKKNHWWQPSAGSEHYARYIVGTTEQDVTQIDGMFRPEGSDWRQLLDRIPHYEASQVLAGLKGQPKRFDVIEGQFTA